MTTAKKLSIVAGLFVLLTIGGWLLIAGLAYALGGVMTVGLVDREGGLEVHLPVPIALLELAVSSVDSPALAAAGFGHVRMDGRGLDLGLAGPVLLDILEELDDLPDATLVEVQDGRGGVRVVKSGDRLIVEVDDPGTSFSVSAPTRGIARLAGRLLD